MKITEQELNMILTDSTYGGRCPQCGSSTKRGDLDSVNCDRHSYGCTWSFVPTRDANHALQVLEALGKEWGIVKGNGGHCVSVYGVAIKCRAIDKCAKIAICLAVAEAATGETYELED